MSLSVNTNVNSLFAQRQARSIETSLATTIARLSSGQRINSAVDDPAGLAISQRMTAGLNGATQAARSLNDGTSLLQVADGAMADIAGNLQRLRELAVQAGNSSYSAGDRAAIQQQAVQVLNQINQVGQQTAFNGEAVFSQDTTSIGGDARQRVVLDGLKTGWLTEAEKLVQQYDGLSGDGANLTVDFRFTDGPGNDLAAVSGLVYSGSGKFNDIHLNIDMADFGSATTPDGGGAPLYSDRIVAHEMVHAIMSRATSFQFPKWFTEGTAELIQGADERLAGAIGGGGGAAVDAVGASVGSGFCYEGGYAASRYMHDKLKQMGVDGGIKGIMQYLNQNQGANLDQALNAVTGGVYANTAAFVADFTANGANFITTKMNLHNADTGAIGGLDADGGPSRNARDVVSDVGDRPAQQPLAGFNTIFPTIGGYSGTRQVQVQAGANAGDTITLSLSAMNASALGLADLDLTHASVALLHIDQALDFVAQQRATTGAQSNRLDIASTTLSSGAVNLAASRSRILDADYASETVALTRSKILQQAATAMLSHANSMPRAVLALLR